MGIGTFLRRRQSEHEEEEARGVVQQFVGLNQTDPEAARSMYPDVVDALITLKRTIPSSMLKAGTPGEVAESGVLRDVGAEYKWRTEGPSLATMGEAAQFPGTVGPPDVMQPRPAGGQLAGLPTKDLMSFMAGKAMSPEISAKEQFQKAALPQALKEMSTGVVSAQSLKILGIDIPTAQETMQQSIQQRQQMNPKFVPSMFELALATGSDAQELAKIAVLEDYSKNRLPDRQLYDIAGLTNTEVTQANEYTKELMKQGQPPLQARRNGIRMAAVKKPQLMGGEGAQVPGTVGAAPIMPQIGLPTDQPTPQAVREERESITRAREQRERTQISGAHLELARASAKDASRRFDEAQALRLTTTQQNTMESVRQGLQLLGIYDAKTGGLDYGKVLEHKHLENPIVFGLVDLLREQILKGGIPELSVPYVDVDEKGKSYIRWTTQDDYNFGVRQGTIKKRTPK